MNADSGAFEGRADPSSLDDDGNEYCLGDDGAMVWVRSRSHALTPGPTPRLGVAVLRRALTAVLSPLAWSLGVDGRALPLLGRIRGHVYLNGSAVRAWSRALPFLSARAPDLIRALSDDADDAIGAIDRGSASLRLSWPRAARGFLRVALRLLKHQSGDARLHLRGLRAEHDKLVQHDLMAFDDDGLLARCDDSPRNPWVP